MTVIDPYTLLHFLAGTMFKELSLKFDTTLLLAVTWELYEVSTFPSEAYIYPENNLNRLIDIVSVLLGWKLNKT